MEQLLILAVWLPFIGFLINGALSLRENQPAQIVVTAIGSGAVMASFGIIAFLTMQPAFNSANAPIEAHFFNWIHLQSLQVNFAYRLDGLSVFMAWIITGIGSLIHIYSAGYMEEEKESFARFFAYLNLFIFSMLHLVLGDSLPLLFLGWEGVGLCSYLLIGFDHHKASAAAAGKKAFITNRVGDAGFLVGMFLLFEQVGSLQYGQINNWSSEFGFSPEVANVIALTLFIGAMGKSAQIPLYVWLPDAMAGPTPVSALIHAATMVTAGVFMIARLAPVFLVAESASTFIAYTGAATALFAALIALTQTDIKKVLAYSTVSQLGYMFLAMGVGAYGAGMFHLMTHAFFKALLFLGSGAVIIALHHEQDMRRMGGLMKHIPFVAIIFWIGAVAISGIPGFSGFFSKDMILEQAFLFKNGGPVLFGMGLLTAVLTSFYMYRLIFLTFHTKEDAEQKMSSHGHGNDDHAHHGIQPVSMYMKFPLAVLAVLSIVGGYVGLPKVITHTDGAIVKYFDSVLQVAPTVATEGWRVHASVTVEWILMILSVTAAFAGLIYAFLLYQKKNKLPLPDGAYRSSLVSASFNKFYIDEVYEAIIIKPLKKLAGFSYKKMDAGFIDAMVDGVAHLVTFIASQFKKLQTGVASDYALYIVVGALTMTFAILGGVI